MNDDCPSNREEIDRLRAAHKRRPAKKKRGPVRLAKKERVPRNGHEKILFQLRKWAKQHEPLHRLIFDAREPSDYIHPVDLDRLLKPLLAQGIEFFRFRRCYLAAERRGEKISDAEAASIKKFAQAIFHRIDRRAHR